MKKEVEELEQIIKNDKQEAEKYTLICPFKKIKKRKTFLVYNEKTTKQSMYSMTSVDFKIKLVARNHNVTLQLSDFLLFSSLQVIPCCSKMNGIQGTNTARFLLLQ